MSGIIDTTIPVSSALCQQYVGDLRERFPFLEACSIGRSCQGKPLQAVRFGRGEHHVLYVGAHHGMEWITSLILLRFLEECCLAFEEKGPVGCYDIPYLYETRSIFMIPMLNPDGVDLQQSGRPGCEKWQANSRGVDLNHNYDAMWQKGKALEEQYGIRGPGPTRYGGRKPESEPETAALCALCRNQNFALALALHSQGEEIYYDFADETPKCSLAMAEIFAAVSGYQVSKPDGIASYSGFKDWFLHELKRPAFTIEVGKGENPLPIGQFGEIYPPCRELLFAAALI